ncbi:MAG TPA: hypothetical protein VJJ76_01560 [archaeon]|nr:hypothetical protein [archaeon]
MIDREKAYEIADMYLIEYVGNLVGPGEPVFDSKLNVWIIPIFHMSKVAKFPLGKMVLDSEGKILYVPTEEELEEIGKRKFPQKIELKT